MTKPNFAKWKKRQLWTLIEASCLLCGFDPVPAEDWSEFRKAHMDAATIYGDLKDAIDLKQIYFAQSRDSFIRGHRVKPDECVTWAAGRGYPTPSELLDLMKPPSNETAAARADRLHRRVKAVRAAGNRAFLKTVAEEEGISVSRLKQLILPLRKTDYLVTKGKTISQRARKQY